MTSAKDIHLSKEEIFSLKKIRDGRQPNWIEFERSTAYKTFCYYSLIEHPQGSGSGAITEKGKQVLLEYKSKEDDRRKNYAHDWKIAVFSGLCGALLSRPIWDLIDIVRSFFTSLFSA